MHARRALVIPVLIIIACAAAAMSLHGLATSHGAVYSIDLRKNGFYPRELHVHKGDTVKFTASVDRRFWPASNPHPVHDIFPAFDPREPISPASSWSFTFDTEGIFRYHDHLAPGNEGVIVVGNSEALSPGDEDVCRKMTDDGQRRTCWESLLSLTLKKQGLDAGIILFKKLAEVEPADCHQYAHDLGQYAYDAFKSGTTPRLGSEATYCGYGFWHGFMTRMSADSGIDSAKRFCASLEEATSQQTSEARSNCFHGVGIGLVPDPPPYEDWGELEPIAAPALRFCDGIEGDDNFSNNCYSGVFHGLIDYMNDERYGFTLDKQHPFAICEGWDEKYKRQCYFQVAPRLATQNDRNVAKTLKLLPAIRDTDVYETLIWITLANFIDRNTPISKQVVVLRECSSAGISEALCVKSLVHSLFGVGVPEKEYVPALELCRASSLPSAARLPCFKSAADEAALRYDIGKLADVCNDIERDAPGACAAIK